MARIRTIKPDYWTDEKLAPLDPLTRLVFLGLISQADDAGRLVDSVRLLDGLLFPFTEDTCGPSLETLAKLERIERYESESGQRLIQIVGWESHQRVKNPSSHVLPAPPLTESSVDSTENRGRDYGDTNPRARAPAAPTPMIQDPSSEEERARDDLSEWLGPMSEALTSCPLAWSPQVRSTLYQHFGPPGLRANAWKRDDGTSVPEAERPRLLTLALTGYAAEGNRSIATNQFAGMIRRVIRDEAKAEGKTGLNEWLDSA